MNKGERAMVGLNSIAFLGAVWSFAMYTMHNPDLWKSIDYAHNTLIPHVSKEIGRVVSFSIGENSTHLTTESGKRYICEHPVLQINNPQCRESKS